nr:arginine repressor C-terminal-like domain-containing protein [Tanacetum cinerariifolium]
EEMGFSLKWRNWAKNCLSWTSISVLVSGSTTCEFHMEPGLRQGVPFLPFSGMFKGLVLNDGEVNMSLWQYADNALILGKWSRRNVRNLVTILNCFQDVYGLDNALILGNWSKRKGTLLLSLSLGLVECFFTNRNENLNKLECQNSKYVMYLVMKKK